MSNNMRNISIPLGLILLCSLFMACQHSPRQNYYLLSAPAVSTPDQQAIEQVIGIGPLEIADYLKRKHMVSVRPDQSLQIAANDFWAEPLDKGIIRVLALNLTQQNPSRMVLPFPWRSDSRPPLSVRLQVHSLNLDNEGASIHVTWEIFDNQARATLNRQHFIRRIPCERQAAAMAKAYGDLLAALAQEIGKALPDQ
ncbi:membrane integrity-associated transporter subunit PqiC [Cellvibrio japonicus]|nr:membrane integrity-associated transporter subunit PqiC [Cellvibrio japonicus]QEI15711.1 membrane integrity-associated transporter subunit PqiC [Cellvibrio japonicus]QEI19289.1 membrane integrity-associated transporter subunit PqiC [Cellvibrio japonicus]